MPERASAHLEGAASEVNFLRLFGLYLKLSLYDAFIDRARAAKALDELASRSYVAGHPDLSTRCLERAAQIAPSPGAVYAKLGSLYYEQGRYDKARDAFNMALEGGETNVDVLRGLAKSYHMLGDYNKATYFYVGLLAENSGDLESRLNLGLAYHLQGRLDDAVEQLRLAAELGHEQGDSLEYYAHLALGKALYDCARFQEAEASLVRSVELNPSMGEAYFYLGLTREALSRPQDAAESYRRALELNPEDAYAHLRLGDLYLNEKDGKNAVTDATHALHLFERYGLEEEQANAYWTIGWGHYLNGEWEQSIAASRRAVELRPQLTPVRFNLGLALLRMGRKDEARREYEQALAGPTDIWDLEMHGIEDLEDAVREDAAVQDAAEEILSLLRARRDELVGGVPKPETESSFSDARA
jgi:tetratricopeptide (TPR) repeat protein